MKHMKMSILGLGVLFSAMTLQAVDATNGKKVIDSKCVACHSGNTDTGLSRIRDQRKTPEGWFMTIERMKRHGLAISGDEQRDVIKYLSDNNGLAPSEIKPYHYVLDQTPNVQEKNLNPKLEEMCVRCHSQARIGLQRRTADEWSKLVNFHVGQFTSLEIQYLSRDRDWFGIATKETAPYLGKLFAKDTRAWSEWQKIAPTVSIAGKWSVLGHTAGKGDFTGEINLDKNSDDSYSLSMDGSYAQGQFFHSTGSAVLYTGSEYRGTLMIGETEMRQVLHYDHKTKTMTGRMYPVEHPETGSTLSVLKASDGQTILGVTPSAIKMGQSGQLKIVGSSLNGDIKLSKSLVLNKIISKTANEIVLDVTALKGATASVKEVHIGKAIGKVALYNTVSKIVVTPDYGVARVGGGKVTKQLAIFEAKGYAKGSKGLIDLGVVQNVTWSIDNYDEKAKEDKDLEFAGTIDPQSGLFTPAEAGPNKKRKWSTNNAGKLAVIATRVEGKKNLKSKAELIVTVQKFVNPPIQ